jgi:hypothetical protein
MYGLDLVDLEQVGDVIYPIDLYEIFFKEECWKEDGMADAAAQGGNPGAYIR